MTNTQTSMSEWDADFKKEELAQKRALKNFDNVVDAIHAQGMTKRNSRKLSVAFRQLDPIAKSVIKDRS